MRRNKRCLNRNFILEKIPNYLSGIETGLLELRCRADQVDISVFILFIDEKSGLMTKLQQKGT